MLTLQDLQIQNNVNNLKLFRWQLIVPIFIAAGKESCWNCFLMGIVPFSEIITVFKGDSSSCDTFCDGKQAVEKSMENRNILRKNRLWTLS